MEKISHSVQETMRISEEWLKELFRNKIKIPHFSNQHATVVGLYGNLGSGKTAFVKAVAKILGVNEEVTSPTFVIIKNYDIKNQIFKKLIHIDAYRLEKGEELEVLKFKHLLNDKDNIIFIEWPENVADAMPENIIKISFEFIDENIRKIVFVDDRMSS